MQISNIQPSAYNKVNNKYTKLKKEQVASQKTGIPVNYTFENVKANFLPSFGALLKAGQTTIRDRESGINVPATIRKQKIGDFVFFEMKVGKDRAGFLDMECNSAFPERDIVLKTVTNVMPEVHHLRSLKGDKYAGIGTELIKTAIQESYNNGSEGNLWLKTEQGYEQYASPYRSGENPIPFYYKVGFVSPNGELDSKIKDLIDNSNYDELPFSTLLLLTPEARDHWLQELVQNPIIKFKKNPGAEIA